MSWKLAYTIINAARRLPTPVARYAQVPRPNNQALFGSPSVRLRPSLPPFPRAHGFHASAKRQALPMIPLLLLKSSSVLPASITLARIMLSFFPVVSMFGFGIRRKAQKVKLKGRPETSPQVEAFVKKWCPEERGRRFTFLQITTMNRQQRKEMIRRIEDSPRPPIKVDGDRNLHFLLPALPPASLAEYSKMSVDEKEEVYLYRRYRASDRFAGRVVSCSRWLLFSIVGLPVLVIMVVSLAALERVPITGRWRVILMSPDEEDAISSNLVGDKWFKSVIALLSTADSPAPPIMPENDWRWKWVNDILRRLEYAALADCVATEQVGSPPLKRSPADVAAPILSPPPAAYPLKPRPRASATLHSSLPGADTNSGKEHLLVGPPFSLLLLRKDEANAFSYGFGGKGAGGIVVYSGLLDSIIAKNQPKPIQPQSSRSAWQALNRLFSNDRAPQPLTTPEQDFHLATVLAHELGHLMLSHHLETLSSRQVFWPSIIGLATDVVRVLVWPVTVLFGPLINDGLSNISKTSVNLLKERVELPLSRIQELEADLVGLRLLARAGYDAEAALGTWGNHVTHLAESNLPTHSKNQGTYQKHWADPSQSHPETQERIEAVRTELERWRSQQ